MTWQHNVQHSVLQLLCNGIIQILK